MCNPRSQIAVMTHDGCARKHCSASCFQECSLHSQMLSAYWCEDLEEPHMSKQPVSSQASCHSHLSQRLPFNGVPQRCCKNLGLGWSEGEPLPTPLPCRRTDSDARNATWQQPGWEGKVKQIPARIALLPFLLYEGACMGSSLPRGLES